MEKKILKGIIMFFIITVLVISGNVYAAETYGMKIEANKTIAEPEDTVTVTFSLVNIGVEPGIGSVTGKLEYDKTVFEKVTNASIKNKSGWGAVVYNDQNESEGLFTVERELADTIKTNNAVFEVTFKVLKAAKLGDTEIKLTNINSSTGEADIVSANVVGKVKIAIKGDVNNDGRITATDIFKMKRHIVKIELLTNAQIAVGDMNGDGKITGTDLLKAKRVLVGLDK